MTRKIAIIGAGPAGYTLAQELVKAGGLVNYTKEKMGVR